MPRSKTVCLSVLRFFGQRRCGAYLSCWVILVQAAIQAVHRRSTMSKKKRRQLRRKMKLRAATQAGINLATPKNIHYLVTATV